MLALAQAPALRRDLDSPPSADEMVPTVVQRPRRDDYSLAPFATEKKGPVTPPSALSGFAPPTSCCVHGVFPRQQLCQRFWRRPGRNGGPGNDAATPGLIYDASEHCTAAPEQSAAAALIPSLLPFCWRLSASFLFSDWLRMSHSGARRRVSLS